MERKSLDWEMARGWRALGQRVWILSVFLLGVTVAGVAAPRLEYRLRVADAEKQLFHVTIEVTQVAGQTLEMALPAWTPGWYTIRPYALNVMRLQAHVGGRRLPLRAIDKQTWAIETGGVSSLTVEYDYFANNLAVNGAELTARRAFFLGTNLFLYVPGQTAGVPTRLTLEMPEGWRVATGLRPAAEQHVYLARDYDQLVDAPTILGSFDSYQTEALGKPIRVVIEPQGLLSSEKAARLTEEIRRLIESQGRMFGGLPYEDYTILYVVGGQGGGALEHENSTNVMLRAMPADPSALLGVTSHEHFHVWNVKRLRPVALLPYEYRREQYVRELWMAEGITSYYADLHLRRAGLISTEAYLRGVAGQIRALQRNEARHWIPVTDASTITWLSYGGGGTYGQFAVNYYGKGELIGLLLDLEIRGVTGNRQSLDDLMRWLIREFADRGRGYTTEDVEAAASQMTGHSFAPFFARYVTGTEELDYDAALGHVGLRLVAGELVDLEKVTAGQRALRRSWLGE
jgi:predicted metalloprotease with PDZ domain